MPWRQPNQWVRQELLGLAPKYLIKLSQVTDVELRMIKMDEILEYSSEDAAHLTRVLDDQDD